MRIRYLAGLVCLLTAAEVNAQPAAPPTLPAGPQQMLPAPDSPASNIDLGTGTESWKMSGPRFWVNGEYLLWFIRPVRTPDLIQTVPSSVALNSFAAGTSLPPGSTTRFFPTSKNLDFGAFSGVRGTVGTTFEHFGVEASYFFLGEQTKSASLFNSGVPVSVAETYFRAGTGTPISLLASLDGISSGGISASVSSKLDGAELNARLPFYNFLTDSTDAIVGFRYFNLEEKINTSFRSDFPNGNSVHVRDSISTKNQFYGGQVGLNGKINGVERGLGFDATGKLALGGVRQQATLEGSNTIFTPGQPADVERGGLFARGASQGTFTRDKFAMIYEQTFNATYNFNQWAQVYFGYSIIYISSVQRPGEAIDRVVNDSRARFIANPPMNNTVDRPAFRWNANDFWTQGMTFGLRLQY